MSMRIDTLVGVLLRGAGSSELVAEASSVKWTFSDAIEQVIRENAMLLLVNDKLDVTLDRNHDLQEEVEAERQLQITTNHHVDVWRSRCKEAERELTEWREGTLVNELFDKLASFKQLAEEACNSVDEYIDIKVSLTVDLDEANKEIKDLKEELARKAEMADALRRRCWAGGQ